MSGFPVLDVAIGMAFLYLLFALTCTTLNEAIAIFVNRRAATLWLAIEQLLGSPAEAQALYDHPAIASLINPKKPEAKPSYIPAQRFAAALIDRITGDDPVTDVAAIQRGIEALPEAARRQLKMLLHLADNQPLAFRQSVASWYEETMDRASGCASTRATSRITLPSIAGATTATGKQNAC